MGAGNESLTGFSWRSGSRRETTGIIMWNDVFLHTLDKTDEKIAIFVMDTQGLFDNDSPSANNLKIFAMGTLISSIPIFNLMNHIQEDHLEYLQFATQLTQHTVMNRDTMYGKPFQNLTFLVRDWINPDDYQHGVNGGQEYIEYILRPRTGRSDQVESIGKSIKESFDQVRCCLLPHPGLGVTNNRNYDGNWSAMDGNFKDEMKNFIESILLPDNLVTKKINGMDINVMAMKQYIIAYFLLFQTGDFPGASSIYELTVEKFMNAVIEKCINEYRLTMFRNMDVITEDDRKKLQAALDKEQEIILEAEKVKKELEDALIKIEEEKMNNKINAEDYNRMKDIYEEYLKLKDEQIQKEKQKSIEEKNYRYILLILAKISAIIIPMLIFGLPFIAIAAVIEESLIGVGLFAGAFLIVKESLFKMVREFFTSKGLASKSSLEATVAIEATTMMMKRNKNESVDFSKLSIEN
ncbi:atlastin-2-like [Chironomus tepperi]|uniref:atlastin-2-like n=1 Tax=Chironomus tepperi TaxID=113505 RepID=UPI00391EED3A